MVIGNSKNDGFLRSGHTIYSRFIVGKYSFYVLLMATIIFLLIPWGELYQVVLYREFLSFMSTISPNLNVLPTNLTNYPMYAVSFVGFINFVGPIFVLLSAYASWLHMKQLALDGIMISMPKLKLVWYLIGMTILCVMFIYFVYSFTGESSVISGVYNTEKWRFIVMIVGSWWSASFLSFCITCILIILKNSIKAH